MSGKPPASTLRLLVGVLLGASMALIGVAVWMIYKDEGSPVFVAIAGSGLAAAAAVIASQSQKKP
jgi:hypothetical protein